MTEGVVALRVGAFEGWLVVDSVANGLAFGGMRIHPSVTETEVRGLARGMTRKLEGHGLPTGGAKAGLRCTPEELGRPEVLAGFAEQLADALRTTVVLGKDMGATDALLDGLYAAVGQPQLALARARWPACPERIRDLAGYVPHMTGRGAAWAAQAALGGDLADRAVAIQGAGLVGLGTAVRVAELGGRVIAISDADQVIAAIDGALDVPALLACAAGDRRRLDPARYAGPHRTGRREDLFGCEADVLVLAASSHSVDDGLAGAVAAPVVVEASNFGLTPSAREVLRERGRRLVPDVVASSASAALVCHQMAAGNRHDPEALWSSIREGIERASRAAVA